MAGSTTDRLPKQIGKYQIQGELGRGAMGIVFRGLDPDLSREVAVKVLPQGASKEMRARFMREGRTSARLRHPGIVAVHETGEADGWAFIVQELIEGPTLGQAIIEEPLTVERAAEIGEGIARALSAAHAEGVIHRDVKPGNVLLDSDGGIHLADFGLARDVDGTQKLSQSGAVIGTPDYMSPEQAEGRLGGIDARSDVWSLGVVLFELVAGRPPFTGETPVKILTAILQEDPIPLSRLVPGVSRDFAAIVHRCLRKEPALRYPSADELADDLARFLRGDRVQASHEGPLSGVRRSIRRNPTPYIAAAAVAMVLAGAGGWIGAQRRAERAAVDEQIALARTLAASAPDQALGLLRSLRERAPGRPELDEIERLAVEGRAAAETQRLRTQAAGLIAMARTAATKCRDTIAQRVAPPDDEYRTALAGAVGARELLSADTQAPEYAEISALMADLALAALLHAEESRDTAAAARFLADLKRFGPESHAPAIRGDGTLSLVSEPAGATVELIRFVDRKGVLEEEPIRTLGTTPLAAVAIPKGSVLLVAKLDGYRDLRLPVLVARGGIVRPPPLRMLTEDQLRPEWVAIPGGATRIGGDPRALDPMPASTTDVGPFLMARLEVTVAQYKQYLEQVAKAQSPQIAVKLIPDDTRWKVFSDGRVTVTTPETHPVMRVEHALATKYAAWRAERDQLPIRLPTEQEWERAARGADGRAFPWGSVMDWERCASGKNSRHTGSRSRFPVGSSPGDISPFGVLDMGGNVKEFCAGFFSRDPERYTTRGGGYSYNAEQRFRCATRYSYSVTGTGKTGIRLVRDWPR